MKQLDSEEWILNTPFGKVSSNLYFMSHCLWSTTLSFS